MSNTFQSLHSHSTAQYRRSALINISIMKDTDPLWHQVHASGSFSIYHAKPWKNLIEGTFKHTAMYLSASEDGMLIDVLPFFLIKNFFCGKKLVSTPYEGCNGGFTCNDAMVRKALVGQMKQLAFDLKVKYVEIRSKYQFRELDEFGFIKKCPLFISELPLISLNLYGKTSLKR